MGVIRKTRSVTLLLNEFEKRSSAIAVIDLIACLSSKMNKTTIYRVLDKLEEDKILHSFLGKNGNKWYAKCHGCSVSGHQDAHPHFQCSDCGKVDCLPTNILIPEIPNRKVDVSQVLLQGKCNECFV